MFALFLIVSNFQARIEAEHKYYIYNIWNLLYTMHV